MLGEADSALIIGDPALHIDPEASPFHVYDLGREWTGDDRAADGFCGMGRTARICDAASGGRLSGLCAFGLRSLERIAAAEAPARGFTTDLVRRYLGSHIVFELGRRNGRDGIVPAIRAGPRQVGRPRRFDTRPRALIK
jgi:hypothetical protein